ncbi:MAG: hypothetical protein HKO62_01945 [Gammaproteobacteria bacterium]|nr:hypothetical protein [Gammaproteobacteria bacterium]
MLRTTSISVGVLLAALSQPAVSETIYIPVGEQAPDKQALQRPERGMRSATVLERFGEPMSMTAPVGDPPISRWVYEDFTAYFEHDTVIHSVLRFTPEVPQPEP